MMTKTISHSELAFPEHNHRAAELSKRIYEATNKLLTLYQEYGNVGVVQAQIADDMIIVFGRPEAMHIDSEKGLILPKAVAIKEGYLRRVIKIKRTKKV